MFQKVVSAEETRVAETMGRFFSHGRRTGGGRPVYPPPEQDDLNALPMEIPEHLQVGTNYIIFSRV